MRSQRGPRSVSLYMKGNSTQARRPRPKRNRAILAIRLGALGAVCALGLSAWSASRTPAKPEELTQVTFEVDNLHCPIWCPVRVNGALGDVPGVWDLTVDVEAGTVSAQVDLKKVTVERLQALAK